MDQARNRQNMRRPVQNRSPQMQNIRRPAQQRTRTSTPAHRTPELMIRRQQLGTKSPSPRRTPTMQKKASAKQMPAPRVSRPVPRTHINQRQSPIKKRKPGATRNFVLATIFAALILVTIIISSVQSCAADQHIDGAVTTAPPKLVKEDANDDAVVGESVAGIPTFAEYTDATEELVIDSEYGILIDLESNTVVASKNGESRFYPA